MTYGKKPQSRGLLVKAIEFPCFPVIFTECLCFAAHVPSASPSNVPEDCSGPECSCPPTELRGEECFCIPTNEPPRSSEKISQLPGHPGKGPQSPVKVDFPQRSDHAADLSNRSAHAEDLPHGPSRAADWSQHNGRAADLSQRPAGTADLSQNPGRAAVLSQRPAPALDWSQHRARAGNSPDEFFKLREPCPPTCPLLCPSHCTAHLTRWDNLIVMLVCATVLMLILSSPLSNLFGRSRGRRRR